MLKRIDELAKTEPVALLGYHYVLLGSKHGGKFIASATKKSYGIENDGCVYFDPYGQGFQQHWHHFTGGINELNLNETQVQELLGAAAEMFTFVETLGGEVLTYKSDN
jgi:heme oxygenase